MEVDAAGDGEIVLIPWAQAVKVARRMIELARARGDLTWGRPEGVREGVKNARKRQS